MFKELSPVEKQAILFMGICHPTRLGIVQYISRYQEVGFTDLQKDFPISQPNLSHHMRVLREAGIVKHDKFGLYVYYHLNRDVLADMTNILEVLWR